MNPLRRDPVVDELATRWCTRYTRHSGPLPATRFDFLRFAQPALDTPQERETYYAAYCIAMDLLARQEPS